jgi:hypothetical protein
LLKKVGSVYNEVVSDMIATTSYNDVAAAGQNQVTYLIIKTGAFMPPPGPFIALNPTSLNFGTIDEQTSRDLPITISNAGSANTLTITNVAFPFSCYTLVEALPVTVGPISSTTVHVRFTAPAGGGTFAGNIVFTHNAAGGTTELPVTGTAYNQETTTLLPLSSGWNLVSVPRIQSEYTASVVFPGALGSLFKYDPTLGDYAEAPILELGWGGYWVYYPNATTASIVGPKPCPITIHCKAGWKLVGSCPDTIEIKDINGCAIFGSAFYYDTNIGDYRETSVILPGQAAWIFVEAECDLTLPCECE